MTSPPNTATFANFALLRAEQSYGGAEVLRAQTLGGVEVHLALFGEAGKKQPAARIVAVADAAAQTAHDQVARILEVGTYDGSLYATAMPIDGVDLAGVLEQDRRKKTVPDVAFSVAVALQLSQLALDLQERGDVWEQEQAAGLSALFPAGLRLDALVLSKDGKLSVRILAGAAADPARPTAFRAPELRHVKPTVASDVFVVAQTLRALLTGDATATSAPRFAPAAAPLGPLLAAALTANPDERLGLFMLVERLGEELARVGGKTPAPAVAASFLKREYRALVPEEPKAIPLLPAVKSKMAKSSTTLLWPKALTAAPVAEFEVDAVLTAELPRLRRNADTSSAVGRVFDELDAEEEQPITQPISRDKLELAAATLSEDRLTQAKKLEKTSESDPPWISMSDDYALVEASGAPPPNPADIESGPTVEMRTMVDDDDDDDIATDDSEKPRPPRRR